MNGLGEDSSRRRRGARRDEVLANLGLTCAADPEMNLAGRQGFFWPISRNPTKTGHFRVNLVAPAIWHLRLLSSAFVYWRLFASCARVMTLAMTLAANDFQSSLRENLW